MMPQMAEIIQKPSKLHITLMVLRLQSDEDIEMCVTTKLKDHYTFLILYIKTSVLYYLFLVFVYSKNKGRWEVIIDDHLVGFLKGIFNWPILTFRGESFMNHPEQFSDKCFSKYFDFSGVKFSQMAIDS